MHIIETIPIRRGIQKESLTYFYKNDIPIGSVVSIPVRGKAIDALVIKSEPLENEKYAIKSKDFALRKVLSIKSKSIYLRSFIAASKKAAEYYAGAAGAVISNLTPAVILENAKALSGAQEIDKTDDGTVAEHSIIQEEDFDRIADYRSIVREEFAKKSSVFFCLPTSADIRKFAPALTKGIEQYAFVFHAGLDKKSIVELWQKALAEEHPILVIGTGNFLSLPRPDLGLIIIDKESSRHYKLPQRPYLDIRNFAAFYASELKAKLVLGDIALRVETIWRFRNNELAGILPPKFKYLSSAREQLVDMKAYKLEEKNEYVFLGREIRSLIRKNKENNENMIVFAGRRGLSPTTVCLDCGDIVRCANCSTPTVLHRKGSKTVYLCHRCNNIEDSERRCSNCGGWRLAAFGVGIEIVSDEIKENFPESNIYRIDSDTTTTEKRVLGEIEKWKNNPGSILLCTEMALPYLDTADNVAIASLDSLFSVPDFRINEKVLGLILQLRAMAGQNFLIQTRQPGQAAVKAGISGNLLDFYRTEIEERQEYGYPPFYHFIKISLSGEKSVIAKEMKEITPLFSDYEFDVFPALAGSVKGKAVMNALLRLERSDWPNPTLLSKLLMLPPKFQIKIDPESLL